MKTNGSDNDVLLQTRVDEVTGTWVSERAVEEGISVAAFLRRLLLTEKKRDRRNKRASKRANGAT